MLEPAIRRPATTSVARAVDVRVDDVPAGLVRADAALAVAPAVRTVGS